MATTSFGPAKPDIDALVRAAQLPSISKATLQTICSVNGLSRSGNKADLQRRIINLVQECALTQDLARFLEVRKSVYAHAPVQSRLPPPEFQPAFQASPAAGLGAMPPSYNYQQGSGASGHKSLDQMGFHFKDSPFYKMQGRLGDMRTLEVMTDHRHSVTVPVKLQDNPLLQSCLTDPTLRIMVFCAGGNTGIQDVSFPYQSELKVNHGEVKANLRGLRNKPGSTRPVDITHLLRLKPSHYINSVEFTYALTTKKYYLGLYVCEVAPLDRLVEQIEKGKRIPKSSVVLEIAKKANDPDVVATSQILSLKCPLSYMRLKHPCRALNCTHIQCFDATSYLQLQEQGPQWICPVCNKPAPFDQLAVDEYVKDILMNTPDSLEQVTIEPNGKWSAEPAQQDEKPEPREPSSVVEDDNTATSDMSLLGSRSLSTPNRSAKFTTPTRTAREDSTVHRSSTSSKRPVAEVVDLTLSDDDDDDDDEPHGRPPAKRQNVNGF